MAGFTPVDELSGKADILRPIHRRGLGHGLLLALLSLILVWVEMRWSRNGSANLSGARYLPFIAAVAWLPPPITLGLGLWTLSLKPLLLTLNSRAASLMLPEWQLELAVEIAAVALCIWLCRLRCTLQQTRSRLQSALQNSLNASGLIHEVRQTIDLVLLQCRSLIRRREQLEHRDPELEGELMALLNTAETLVNTSQSAWALLRGCNHGRMKAVELGSLVRSQLNSAASGCKDNSTTLQCVGLEHEAWLHADAGQLLLLLKNLISNAIAALNSVPATQRVIRVELDVQRSQRRVWLTVADSGPGLPSLDPDQLCLRSHRSSGLGLGLFIAREVARQHGGALVLGKSQELGGAQLKLSLPLASRTT